MRWWWGYTETYHPARRACIGSLLVDRENNRMGGRIDVEADDVFELLGELRVRRQLERAHAMRRARRDC